MAVNIKKSPILDSAIFPPKIAPGEANRSFGLPRRLVTRELLAPRRRPEAALTAQHGQAGILEMIASEPPTKMAAPEERPPMPEPMAKIGRGDWI